MKKVLGSFPSAFMHLRKWNEEKKPKKNIPKNKSARVVSPNFVLHMFFSYSFLWFESRAHMLFGVTDRIIELWFSGQIKFNRKCPCQFINVSQRSIDCGHKKTSCTIQRDFEAGSSLFGPCFEKWATKKWQRSSLSLLLYAVVGWSNFIIDVHFEPIWCVYHQ